MLDKNSVSKPFFYTVPPGLVVIVVIVVGLVVVGRFTKSEEQKIKELFEDERYQAALKIMGDRAETTALEATEGEEPPENPADDGGFGEAVDSLVKQGIERDEAEQNLGKMLAVIAQMPDDED